MLIIEFYEGQGLGNQLWVYVVMRYLARRLEMPYIVLEPEKFKAKNFLKIDYGQTSQTKLITEKIDDGKIHFFKETMYLDMDLNSFMIDYDEKILNIKPYTKIDGYFQSEKYLYNDLDFMRSLLPIMSELVNEILVEEDTCVLNIRGGEYTGNINLILPKSYWDHAMEHMRKDYGIEKFIIVTDDHDYSQRLFPDLKIVTKGIAESYIALHQAKYLIVSNSSFSYFPIKTQKEKPFVIAPMHWARFNNKYKRWASPANLYKDWYWQDSQGELFTYEECLGNYDENMKYYNTHYNIRVKDDITKYFNSYSIKKFIPKTFKEIIKKLLPYELAKSIARKIK